MAPSPLRAPLAILVALGALATFPMRAQAQGARVDGVVYDSLGGKPLAGAIVQVVQPPPGHSAYSATTDSLGRFTIEGMHAGQYLTGFLSPLLDTLGVVAPYGSIVITDGAIARVALAIPTAARLRSAICAPAKASSPEKSADSSGTLVGHVYDVSTGAAVPSSLVAVVWPVITVAAGGVHRETRQLHAKTNDDGWFAICGLEAGDYQLRAEQGARNTGYVDFTLQPREIGRISLILGADSSAGAVLAGRVTARDGRLIEGAQVIVDGSRASATTDSRGMFSLSGLPNGTRMVEARALGYAPTRARVTPSGEEQPPVTIVMDKRVETLEPITVFGKTSGRMRDLTGFVERSRRGFGHFITRDRIDKTTSTTVCDLLREVPGVSVSGGGGMGCDASIRGMGSLSRCGFTVYVDNMKFNGSMQEFTTTISPREITGIEVYSSATEPPQFPGGCGSLVVWTR